MMILKKIPLFIVNTIIKIALVVVYLTVVLLTSLVARLVGKKFMFTKWEKKKSYWQPLDMKKQPIEEYHRQF
ncbi:MAG: hypothetical protein KJ709_04895 [Nanoarchaeota archaeon]|nr:hypothetical protein [Nanoarchaeota archaeon]